MRARATVLGVLGVALLTGAIPSAGLEAFACWKCVSCPGGHKMKWEEPRDYEGGHDWCIADACNHPGCAETMVPTSPRVLALLVDAEAGSRAAVVTLARKYPTQVHGTVSVTRSS